MSFFKMIIDKLNLKQNYNHLLPAVRDYLVLYFDGMQINNYLCSFNIGMFVKLTVSLYRPIVHM